MKLYQITYNEDDNAGAGRTVFYEFILYNKNSCSNIC